MNPIVIDLSGLRQQFGLAAKQIEDITEAAVQEVTIAIKANWEALAKEKLKSTLPEYLENLNVIDKGRFAKQIVLTGIVPNMVEQGASAFDLKDGFRKSQKVRYSVPVYNKKGEVIKPGGDWYLTIPFRIGTPGTLGQAGFSNEMPQDVYDILLAKPRGNVMKSYEIPNPHNIPKSRQAILNEQGGMKFPEYQHKHSIYEGLGKNTGVYGKTTQNKYGTFRRAGENSDPMSWIHKGIAAYRLADQAVETTDVDTIVQNKVLEYLNEIL